MDLTSIVVLAIILVALWLMRRIVRVWVNVGEAKSVFVADKIGLDLAKEKKALMGQEASLKSAVAKAKDFDDLMETLGSR